jgi:hypothetical protein
MAIIVQLIKIELINATSSITVVIVRIMHQLSVILASGVLVNIHSFSVYDKNFCQIGQVVRQDFVILKLDPDFKSPVPHNSVQYPTRQKTQVTASCQPSYNYY